MSQIDYDTYKYELEFERLQMMMMNMATTSTATTLWPPGYPSPGSIYKEGESFPKLNPQQLEDYIKRLREHNHWNLLDKYKVYLRYCEKNFPEDKVWGYHQKDKWQENLRTFKASPMFTNE